MPQILVVARVIGEVGEVGEDLLLGVCNGKRAGLGPRAGCCRRGPARSLAPTPRLSPWLSVSWNSVTSACRYPSRPTWGSTLGFCAMAGAAKGPGGKAPSRGRQAAGNPVRPGLRVCSDWQRETGYGDAQASQNLPEPGLKTEFNPGDKKPGRLGTRGTALTALCTPLPGSGRKSLYSPAPGSGRGRTRTGLGVATERLPGFWRRSSSAGLLGVICAAAGIRSGRRGGREERGEREGAKDGWH